MVAYSRFLLNYALKFKYPPLSITKNGSLILNSDASIRRDCLPDRFDKDSRITLALYKELINNQNEASLSLLLTYTTRKLSTFYKAIY